MNDTYGNMSITGYPSAWQVYMDLTLQFKHQPIIVCLQFNSTNSCTFMKDQET